MFPVFLAIQDLKVDRKDVVEGLLSLLHCHLFANGGFKEVDFAHEVRESEILKDQYASENDFLDMENLINISFLIHM